MSGQKGIGVCQGKIILMCVRAKGYWCVCQDKAVLCVSGPNAHCTFMYPRALVHAS